MKNQFNATLSTEAFNTVLTKLNEIKAVLPFLVSLSPLERKRGKSFGRLGNGLGKAISQSSKVHLQATPREFVVETFDGQINFQDMMQVLQKEFTSITQSIDDTCTVNGQSIREQANEVYAALKRAAKLESKYRASVNELSTYYKKSKVKKITEPAATPQSNE